MQPLKYTREMCAVREIEIARARFTISCRCCVQQLYILSFPASSTSSSSSLFLAHIFVSSIWHHLLRYPGLRVGTRMCAGGTCSWMLENSECERRVIVSRAYIHAHTQQCAHLRELHNKSRRCIDEPYIERGAPRLSVFAQY